MQARGLALRCGAAASRSACKKNPFVQQTIRFVRVADVAVWWHGRAAVIFRVVGCGGTVVWCARWRSHMGERVVLGDGSGRGGCPTVGKRLTRAWIPSTRLVIAARQGQESWSWLCSACVHKAHLIRDLRPFGVGALSLSAQGVPPMSNYFDPFAFPRAKVERADSHLKHLNKLFDEWAAHTQVRLQAELNDEGTYWIIRLWKPPPPPPLVTIMLGEAFHQLRSCLDHAAFAINRALGKEGLSPHQVAFPVGRDQTAFDDECTRHV